MHPTQVHIPNSASNNPFSNVLYDAMGKETVAGSASNKQPFADMNTSKQAMLDNQP